MAVVPLSNEDKLKRLIYIANVRPKYYCGGPEKYTQNKDPKFEFLKEIISNDFSLLLKTIETVNNDSSLPFRTQIFNVLCSSMIVEDISPKYKNELATLAHKLMQSDEDFFEFVHYVSTYNNRKLKTSARRIIRLYYKDKTPLQLAQCYASTRSVHGWTHKRLIRISHVKSETPAHDIVLTYILKKQVNEPEQEEDKRNVEFVKKCDELRKASDAKVAIPLISELKASINLVDGSLRKSAAIWTAVIPNLSVKEILQSLPKLYKHGFLKKEGPLHAKISEVLTTQSKVIESGIHPIEVFIQLKNFEKGGKPADAQLIHHLTVEKQVSEEALAKVKAPAKIKSQTFINSIQKCMNISINNVKGCNKRFLITIDSTNKMDTPCIGSKNISGVEAAAACLWYLLRTENHVTVAVFKENGIKVIPMEKRYHIQEYVQKIKDNQNEYLVLPAPIEWASNHKKNFDVFINFIYHSDYSNNVPKEVKETLKKPIEVLRSYRKKFKLPNAKLINVCFSSTKLNIADGSPNVLDIVGLDSALPKVIDTFSRDHFC